MANEVTITSIEGFSGVAVKEAMFYLNSAKATDLSQVVTLIPIEPGTRSAIWQGYGSVTTETVSDGSNPSNNAAFAGTSVTFAPTSYEAAKQVWTENASQASMTNSAMSFGQGIARGLINAWNQDIYDLFGGFSNTVGASGTALSISLVDQAVNELRDNVGGVDEIILAVPYAGLYALGASATSGGNFPVQTQVAAIMNGTSNKLNGMTVVPVSNLTITDTADTCVGVFTKNALGMAIRQWDTGSVIKINPVQGGLYTTLFGFASYQVKELVDTFGVGVKCSIA